LRFPNTFDKGGYHTLSARGRELTRPREQDRELVPGRLGDPLQRPARRDAAASFQPRNAAWRRGVFKGRSTKEFILSIVMLFFTGADNWAYTNPQKMEGVG